jgi:hypothetical protein
MMLGNWHLWQRFLAWWVVKPEPRPDLSRLDRWDGRDQKD